jgi:hypothetical protein
MPKKPVKSKIPSAKRLILPNDEPVKINMPFEDAVKKALNTQLRKKEKYESVINGHLDIFVAQNEDDSDGQIIKWNDILIHGDPMGLKSLAQLLIKMADRNQDDIINIPIGERDHIHLRPKYDLSNSSEQVIIGRLDAKGTGKYYERFVPKTKALNTPIKSKKK